MANNNTNQPSAGPITRSRRSVIKQTSLPSPKNDKTIFGIKKPRAPLPIQEVNSSTTQESLGGNTQEEMNSRLLKSSALGHNNSHEIKPEPNTEPANKIQKKTKTSGLAKYSLNNLIKEKQAYESNINAAYLMSDLDSLIKGFEDDDYDKDPITTKVDKLPSVIKDTVEQESQLQKIMKNKTFRAKNFSCRIFQKPQLSSPSTNCFREDFTNFFRVGLLYPQSLQAKDFSELLELILYHETTEVVSGAYQTLINRFRHFPEEIPDFTKITTEYFLYLGTRETVFKTDQKINFYTEFFFEKTKNTNSESREFFNAIPYINLASFLDLITSCLKLKSDCITLDFAENLCLLCLFMLMDNQLTSFALQLEGLFSLCFDLLVSQYSIRIPRFFMKTVTTLAPCDTEPVDICLIAQAQTLLLESFPILVYSQSFQDTVVLLQEFKIMSAFSFLKHTIHFPSKSNDKKFQIFPDDDEPMLIQIFNLLFPKIPRSQLPLDIIYFREHPDSSSLNVSDTIDYNVFISQIEMLHYCLDPFIFHSRLMDIISTLGAFLQHLHSRIADGGDIFMERSEAKEHLQQLYIRLKYYQDHHA